MPPFHEICAVLADEPHRLRPWEVKRLTDFQLEHIYFAPRDDEGKLIRSNPSRRITLKEMYYEGFRSKGLREAEIDSLWATREAKLKERDGSRHQ